MTENGRYKNECAHLNDRQRVVYHNLEEFIMGGKIDDAMFIDAMIAVQTLGKTMGISHAIWKSRLN